MRGSFVTLAVASWALGACGNATPAAKNAETPEPQVAAQAPRSTPSAPSPAPDAPVNAATAAAPEADAQSAVQAWLAEVDSGQYAQSWTEAATPFRGAVAQADWVKAASAVRAPLGSLKSRTLRSAHFAKHLPGAPDGEYVVMQFVSAFDSKPEAIETVTPMKEADGRWRVSGYFIR